MELPPPIQNSDSRSAEAAPEMSLFGRLFNIFATPGEVFDSLKGREAKTSNWLVPALLLMIVGWVGAYLVFSNPVLKHQLDEISAREVEKQIEKAKMPPEQAEQVRAAAEKYGSVGTRIAAFSGPPFAALATTFIWGLIIWFVGKVAFKIDIGYMKAVEVVGLAAMIAVLNGIVGVLLKFVTGNFFAEPSLALLVMKDFNPQDPMHGALNAMNVMALWVLVVRALGLARLAGGSFVKAAAWVIGIWLAWNGFLIGVAAAVKAAFNR